MESRNFLPDKMRRSSGGGIKDQIESIPVAAVRKLSTWYWLGNIRKLKNFIERSVILTRGTALQAPVAELGNNGRNSQ